MKNKTEIQKEENPILRSVTFQEEKNFQESRNGLYLQAIENKKSEGRIETVIRADIVGILDYSKRLNKFEFFVVEKSTKNKKKKNQLVIYESRIERGSWI